MTTWMDERIFIKSKIRRVRLGPKEESETEAETMTSGQGHEVGNRDLRHRPDSRGPKQRPAAAPKTRGQRQRPKTEAKNRGPEAEARRGGQRHTQDAEAPRIRGQKQKPEMEENKSSLLKKPKKQRLRAEARSRDGKAEKETEARNIDQKQR
jgi:hypothetical protein